ncbi:MAG: bifunctional phosphoribosylaminoimidazolecarboxamide formyltransferase/IMP cyclohydrolase [Candidatus Izemoplasmatales bacterium]|nr:bifunctional phosphoribosylaminoimidazolecarboxamide formyltransferase/IMP cyclohydrolase [Candidatus Izemoplasmatales bacterium]
MSTKAALISVYDKTGLEKFAQGLLLHGYSIVSTGGTAAFLKELHIPVRLVEDITNVIELLDGRVKTLHPAIFGGILARRNHPADVNTLSQLHYPLFDMVVVSLYPFSDALTKSLPQEQLLEYIDIGGVSLLRAAAKNFRDVLVVSDVLDYPKVLEHLTNPVNNFAIQHASKAFQLTASYDALIAQYFNQSNDVLFPQSLTLTYTLDDVLRYGENPHQQAAVYKEINASSPLLDASILHGKKLSYNNLRDAEAALQLLREFKKPTVVALKHLNPCGVSSKETLLEAWNEAFHADSISIYGGIVATNQMIDYQTALSMHSLCLEIIIAQGCELEALKLLQKKKNLRLLAINDFTTKNVVSSVSIEGGLLYQTSDTSAITFEDFELVSTQCPSPQEYIDLLFAIRIARHVKSNAIVIAKNETTLGIGAGQMNRVGAANIALTQANSKSIGSVLASDGFIPMVDTIHLAAKYGIKAIIQPGGSVNDKEVIEQCNAYNISMVFTKKRYFKH